MSKVIGIRRETKDNSEKRAALTPNHVKSLIKNHNIKVIVQPSETRIFNEKQYENAGAVINEDLSPCSIILGVKEVPVEDLIENKLYSFFSHTMKGQEYNMPMLKSILEKNISLLDYELIVNDAGKRKVFFGPFAGYAGMIDSLHVLGKRYAQDGFLTPFSNIKKAYEYSSLAEAEKAVFKAGKEIRSKGLPDNLVPFITGFTGHGQVSQGAQQVYNQLPVVNIPADTFFNFIEHGEFSSRVVYKVVFNWEDMYRHKQGRKNLKREDVIENPENYQSNFAGHLSYLSVVMNCIYWEPRYPRLVTKENIKLLFAGNSNPILKVIGDITCDIEGSIELTVKPASSDMPAYVYNPDTDSINDGYEGKGVAVMAVDNLPTELPIEASEFFGNSLLPVLPGLFNLDLEKSFENINFPHNLDKAIIAHKGRLTPSFEYLHKYIA